MLGSWQRIERVVKWTGLSINSFALSIGLNRGENLYQIKRGNNGISPQLAAMIAAKYPQISRAWVLTGEGGMIASERVEQGGVPFFDVDVEKYAATPMCFVASGYVSLPQVDGVDFAALYKGRAMGAEIPTGSMVLAGATAAESLIPGGDYIVATEGFTMLRRVRREPQTGVLRLLPIDTDNFDEIRIAPEQIKELYRVKMVVVDKNV